MLAVGLMVSEGLERGIGCGATLGASRDAWGDDELCEALFEVDAGRERGEEETPGLCGP